MFEAESLTNLLLKLDSKGNGELSLEMFSDLLKDESVLLSFAEMGITVRDASMFYAVLSQAAGSSSMLIADFAELCTSMKGHATGIDIAGLQYEVRLLRRMLTMQDPVMGSYVSKVLTAHTLA